MKLALVFSFMGLLAACVSKEACTRPETSWRCRMKEAADGSRAAVAVEERTGCEEALPQGLWCPHGALIALRRDGAGKIVDAVSRPEPVRMTSVGKRIVFTDDLTGMQASLPLTDGAGSPFDLRAFALAPLPEQRHPWVILRWWTATEHGDFALLERREAGLRLTSLGPWQVEHLQFQRMERPGKGLENALLLTFQAGEGTQDCVVKVEAGQEGARLRPAAARDAAVMRGFLGRATPAEKAVVEKILAE